MTKIEDFLHLIYEHDCPCCGNLTPNPGEPCDECQTLIDFYPLDPTEEQFF